MREAERRNLVLENVTDFTQTPGQGISGIIGGRRCCVGNAALLAARGIALDEGLRRRAEACAEEGKSVLYVVRDTAVLGFIAVADAIRKGSRRAVAELESLGIEVIMLTGDNARTAEAVRKQAGIGRALAEVLPEDKEREIRSLQAQGKKVAMVGDGINDAPALARADVGIAVGAGTDIAVEAADIVLMKNELSDVVTTVLLSRAVMRTIRRNLFWAFFYNSVGIPVAAGALYGLWGVTLNPMIAAAAMSLSSVSVVSSALRLRSFSPKPPQVKCGAEDASSESARIETEPPVRKRSGIMKKTLHIEGMSCGHCAGSVEKALRALPGVTDVRVDPAAKTAVVEAGDTADESLSAAVTAAGFQVLGIDCAAS